ncbi:MAG: AraC family transcriptional regulator ligand-binding domain-containing protein [Cellvibrionaceae bacterium]
MQQSPDYISSGFIEPLLDYLHLRRLDAYYLEHELRLILEKPVLCADQFCDLLDAVYQLDPVATLGFRLGKLAKPKHYGVLGYLTLSCGNLGQALTRYRRFQNLLQTGLESWVISDGKNIQINWRQKVANTPLAQAYSVAIFVNLYQLLLGKEIAPLGIALPFKKPIDSDIYEALMGCPIDFDSDNLSVTIPMRLMAMHIASRDSHLRQLLEAQAQAMVNEHGNSQDSFAIFFEQLQNQLVNMMKDGDVSAQKVADNLGIPLRSFYRKLNENGHSFRSIIADVRLRLSKQYLSDLKLSHSEIALLLGYSEQSSFIRAFRSWAGLTPGEYRERLTDKK